MFVICIFYHASCSTHLAHAHSGLNEYEGYFDFFNLPIYTDRISELIQAKILKKSFTLIVQNIMSSIKC